MNETDLHFDVAVVGLGKTGLSCVRYLSKQGLNIAVTDSRDEPPELTNLKSEFDSVPVYLGEISSEALLASDQIILSPGVSLENKSVKQVIEAGIPVFGDIELFCQQAKAPIIAISGSNGKSTVTTLVAEMTHNAGLKTCVGGNLGTPALELLDEPVPDVYVLELSSFQLETTFSLNAHASVVLNVSPDHMDRYETLNDYINAKNKIYYGQGLMVINGDDDIVKAMNEDSRRCITFTLSKPEGNNFGVIKEGDEAFLCQGNVKIINQKELAIKGEHNIANALAAMALASSLNVPFEIMVDVLKSFKGLEHRCQLVKTINNVSWYNDSKATNVGACIASIKGLCELGSIILIAGGDSKGADLSSLTLAVKQHVKNVLLMGVDADKLAKTIGSVVACEFVPDMDAAVSKANQIAAPGDLVLLAPACASLDMYKNYQERGDMFVKAVNALEAC
ncbi:MAG: UDP-N-acetylmuramoyl-L-alanine--D-glutamate ligase [Proteobacteria bacterium]|nr:UDP-N-acetylmuramoyl-L-alanine--D-glutamate ligase [Pseudomonadota bacterium]NOG60088.1 UDP-N-acetylmuramoyl-L-alanine--D-glutamate ligase [Pseudomonadota bacterium]